LESNLKSDVCWIDVCGYLHLPGMQVSYVNTEHNLIDWSSPSYTKRKKG